MNELLGYLRWQTRGALRTPSFYGCLLLILSIVMVGHCPDPWPMTMAIVGLGIFMYELGSVWFRITMTEYRHERDRVVSTLKKEQL